MGLALVRVFWHQALFVEDATYDVHTHRTQSFGQKFLLPLISINLSSKKWIVNARPHACDKENVVLDDYKPHNIALAQLCGNMSVIAMDTKIRHSSPPTKRQV